MFFNHKGQQRYSQRIHEGLSRLRALALSCLLILSFPSLLLAQYDGVVGTEGCQAISYDNPNILGWASGCTVIRGYQNIALPDSIPVTYGDTSMVIGAIDASTTEVMSLGDGGMAILTFDIPIRNGEGYDFAVFENSLDDTFLELAIVEVSSDGVHWVRFPAVSNTPTTTQIGSFGKLDATKLHNLAGKYRAGWGTPFDLEELTDSANIDINHITHIKVIDVVGTIDPQYATYDSRQQIINDPYPTNFYSGGFDLSGVAVLNGWLPNAINETTSSNRWSVYPNPCTDYILIEGKEQGQIILYNICGQILHQCEMSSNTHSINMQSYPAGVYILSINQKNIKFIKR